jgi:succinoglycan biosynthesis transport protein ExoP
VGQKPHQNSILGCFWGAQSQNRAKQRFGKIKEMELEQYLQIVRKWLWLIVLGTLLAAGVSYGVNSFLPPVYRASTSLLIRTTRPGGDDYGTVIVNQYLAATYSELMTKRPIIEAAGLNLGLSPSAIRELMAEVEVWVVPDTSVIRLTVEDSDPRLAMELASEMVSVFVQAQRESGGSGRDIFVVEPAGQPVEPVAPRRLFNTLVAAIGGCALAAGAAFLIEYLDDTLGTAEDINHSLSLPTLAAIPRPNHRQKRNKTLIAMADPMSSLAEAYRVLCTKIQFSHGNSRLGGGDELNTVLLTSPSSRKEKANVAVNLGIVMAQAGLKVLLVDADLRQPQLHHVFGLTNEIGLTTLLAGNKDCQACIARTDISNLCVLSSGPPLLEPLALSSQQMAHLIEELGAQADIVLFDAPPVLAVAEVMALALQVEGTILAIESRSTRREVARQAMERLQSVEAQVLGVVLNEVRDKQYGQRENKREW